MAHKRPFDEVVNEVSPKHQRQDGPAAEIISHRDDRFSKEADIVKLHDSGETSVGKGEVEYYNYSCPDVLKKGVEETESDAPRSASLSHWTISSTSIEDEPPEEMVHLPYYSGYFNFDRPVRSECNPDVVHHSLLEYPPRKGVPIGPDHQANIPPWAEYTSNGNFGDVNLNGTCIMPNLETQSLTHNISKAGDGRVDCRCLDRGSIRCVRLHIAEARDKLKRVLGHGSFMELGFTNMGEVVADKWTNEEEQLFHAVVYSNPVSLGKNFWVALSAVFPSRTEMEIVSYFFNVFMLRKRAEQNRCNPMNIDSDNDDWPGSDDDDDSGIESPGRYNAILSHQNMLHAHDYEEDDDDGDVSDDAQEIDENNGQGHIRSSDPESAFQFPGKKSDDGGENDVQDGSCTSSDSGASVQEAQTQNDRCHESHDWHEYILDSTCAKAWDGYMNCPKSDIDLDFLPTCSMIEEVFGGGLEPKDKRW